MPTAQILVPFGTKYVVVEEIPRLIANALHPDRLFEGVSDRSKIDAILLRQAYAQDAHERIMHRHILSGELAIRNSVTMEILPAAAFPSAVVALKDFESYVKQFDMNVAFDFISIFEVLPALASKLVDENPVRWRKPGQNNDLRCEVAIGFATRYLQDQVEEMARLGRIWPINGWPGGGEFIDDASWGVRQIDAEYLRKSLKLDPPISFWSKLNQRADEKETQRAQYAWQEEAKRSAGRYTLKETATYISMQGDEDYKRILKRVEQAALNGEIAMYPPGSNQKLKYEPPHKHRTSFVRNFYEEAYWSDLNSWLERYEPRIRFRFPNPQLQPARDKGPVSTPEAQRMSPSEGRITILEFAERIAAEAADRHPDKWIHPTDPDPLRRTIVAAMNTHGWSYDGIPGVLSLIYKEIESGRIAAFSTFNDLPSSGISEVRATPAKWYITREGEAQLMNAIVARPLTPAPHGPITTRVISDSQALASANGLSEDRGSVEKDIATPDPTLVIIQQTYDAVFEKTGKAPSKRKVAEESGYARETVRARWSRLKRVDQPK